MMVLETRVQITPDGGQKDGVPWEGDGRGQWEYESANKRK